jgi:hypothetical protein
MYLKRNTKFLPDRWGLKTSLTSQSSLNELVFRSHKRSIKEPKTQISYILTTQMQFSQRQKARFFPISTPLCAMAMKIATIQVFYLNLTASNKNEVSLPESLTYYACQGL